ncbi:hypothetical protein [Weissella hellenica]
MNIKLKRISKKYGNDERLYAAMTADEGQAFLLLMNKLKEEMFANFSEKITWQTDLLDRNNQEFGYRQIRERDQYNNLEFEINL